MAHKNFENLVQDILPHISEIFPWDLQEEMESGKDVFLLDIRCPIEYQAMHIENSINVPRGVLETACDYGYEHTVPELVQARDKRVIIICRSGKRSALAAYTMQVLGYTDVVSLKTGLRGWNDSEYPLVNLKEKRLPFEQTDVYFVEKITPEQLGEKGA